jgi:hypothetical protein
MPLALPAPTVRRKRHESVTDRGVRNCSAASGQHESQEGRSHARSTRQALADFDQQVSVATGAIRELTSEAERTRYWAKWRGSSVRRATHSGGFCLNFPWRNGC